MAVDLLFIGAPLTGHPVDLVFGESDTPVAEDTVVNLVAALPALAGSVALTLGFTVGLTGSFPALAGSIEVVYATDTARPEVGQVSSRWQGADDTRSSTGVRWDDTARQPSGTSSRYQSATRTDAQVVMHGQEAIRLRDGSAARFQRAQRLVAQNLSAPFQNTNRLRRGAESGFEEAIRLGLTGAQSRFQEGDKRARNWAAARYQDAVAFSVGVTARERRAAELRLRWASEYQRAMRPPAGDWIPPGPQPPDPCYMPPDGDAVHLLFSAPWSSSGDLIFVCERHDPEPPGDTVVVPVRGVYLVINSAVLVRVVGAVSIPTTSMSMSLDVDSWTWSFSASVPGYALETVEPTAGVPVEVQAVVNGVPYRFIVESISRERVFGRNDLRIGGRGRAAVLDAPYAPIMTFGNTGNRTAQQIANDILMDNGVPLGWDVEWNPADWNVPAGVFNHQGSYITALNAVVGSVGAYLQPHNTAQELRVMERYPVPPWDWGTVTPDFELPAAVVSRESIEWRDKAAYNRVFVMGQGVGVNGRVTRTGTAGDYLAPSVVDALITEEPAARMRGRAILSDTGRVATVGLRLPVLPETGIIKPGNFVTYVDGGVTRIGITRSVQVDVGLPAIWQVLGVETHE